jgi:hypothetical protein
VSGGRLSHAIVLNLNSVLVLPATKKDYNNWVLSIPIPNNCMDAVEGDC